MNINQVSNITHNFIHELNIEKKTETEIQRLVKQHWAKRGVLYIYIYATLHVDHKL